MFVLMNLLMNLLIAQIAQIAKTFDDVYEASGLNSLFLFSQTVSTWNDAPPFPPPFNLCWLCRPRRGHAVQVGCLRGKLQGRAQG
jgi:hypothetical protein